jgi:hypothetical protein
MAFASNFLRLVGLRPSGDEIAPIDDSLQRDPRSIPGRGPDEIPEGSAAVAAQPVELVWSADLDREVTVSPTAPGLADIQAAIALVEGGLSKSVRLVGLQAWPGLLWQAAELAREADVEILATAIHGEGRVDLQVSRGASGGG